MFGYTCIKESKLEFLHYQVSKLEKEFEQEHAKYIAELHYSMKKQQQCIDNQRKIDDLEVELLKYKQLYTDELQKRLALADLVRESETKVED